MPTALVALCKTNIFIPYIHHTIQKWGLDLWVIRCPMSLVQPNKDSSTFLPMEPEKLQMWGFGQISNILPTQANPGLFSKNIHQFYVPGSSPEVTTMNWWRSHTLLMTEVDVTQGPITNCLTSKNSGSFQSPPHTRTVKQVSRGKYPGVYALVSNPLSDRLTVLYLLYSSRNRETHCTISCELTEIHNGH